MLVLNVKSTVVGITMCRDLILTFYWFDFDRSLVLNETATMFSH